MPPALLVAIWGALLHRMKLLTREHFAFAVLVVIFRYTVAALVDSKFPNARVELVFVSSI